MLSYPETFMQDVKKYVTKEMIIVLKEGKINVIVSRDFVCTTLSNKEGNDNRVEGRRNVNIIVS